MSVRLRRLQAEYERLRLLFKDHPRIRIVETAGDPPDRYTIEYHLKGLVQEKDSIQVREVHRAKITLGPNFPKEMPQCVMLTSVFHPNIDHLAICTEDIGSAGQTVDQLIVFIGEMITYQAYNIQSPRNGEAAQWAREHASEFPLERVNLTPAVMLEGEANLALTAETAKPTRALECCDNCGASSAATPLRRCSSGHLACPECALECANCRKLLCVSCQLLTCSACRRVVCSDCVFTCPGCGNAFCLEHVGRCAVCNRYECAGCASKCASNAKPPEPPPVEVQPMPTQADMPTEPPLDYLRSMPVQANLTSESTPVEMPSMLTQADMPAEPPLDYLRSMPEQVNLTSEPTPVEMPSMRASADMPTEHPLDTLRSIPEQVNLTSEPTPVELPSMRAQADMPTEPPLDYLRSMPEQVNLTSEPTPVEMLSMLMQADMPAEPPLDYLRSMPEQVNLTSEHAPVEMPSMRAPASLSPLPLQVDLSAAAPRAIQTQADLAATPRPLSVQIHSGKGSDTAAGAELDSEARAHVPIRLTVDEIASVPESAIARAPRHVHIEPMYSSQPSGKAITAFVFGILGMPILGILLGWFAILFAILAKKDFRTNPALFGRSLATTALMLGIFDILLWALVIAVYVATALRHVVPESHSQTPMSLSFILMRFCF
jgi:ubiquitin-protein ligase